MQESGTNVVIGQRLICIEKLVISYSNAYILIADEIADSHCVVL